MPRKFPCMYTVIHADVYTDGYDISNEVYHSKPLQGDSLINNTLLA